MKMENTLENKSKFFALYFGQRIMKKNIEGLENFITEPDGFLRSPSKETYLELKSLSSIRDEDAIEVAKIFNIGHLNGAIVELIKSILSALDGSTRKSETTEFVLNWLSAQDYLRSKGYALPWMGISVEQQVEWGWVKLKEEKK